MKKLIGLLSAIGSLFKPGISKIQDGQSYLDTPDPIRRSSKSSGGSGKRLKKIEDTEHKAWRRVFGGLAVPTFSFLCQPTNFDQHFSSARGVRPYSFYKMTRAA